MKTFIYLVGAACAALAYVILQDRKASAVAASAPVDDLAHKLQDAWADHHTVA